VAGTFAFEEVSAGETDLGTTFPGTTSTFSEGVSEGDEMSATWYAIAITDGLEKTVLPGSAAGLTSTPVITSMGSSTSSQATETAASSSSGGSRAFGTAKWLASAVGGAII